MEAKINKDGVLEIKRDNIFKKQFCRFSASIESVMEITVPKYDYCSDDCSLFGEPEYKDVHDKTELSLCKKSLFFSELIDERDTE